MNAKVFERWFANTLISNIPKDRKFVIVMDNAKYHSRPVEKSPTMKMRKNVMISYMIKHHIEIPSLLPAKPALLQKILEANIPNKYVIDEMALDAGHSVLKLSLYYCVFNPVEMVRS